MLLWFYSDRMLVTTEVLHATGLLSELDLFAAEDTVADYISESASSSGSSGSADEERVRKLIAHSECFADDGDFASAVQAEVVAALLTPPPESGEKAESGEKEKEKEKEDLPSGDADGKGKVLLFIQRRPVMDGLADDSEIHVIWATAPSGREPEPEPALMLEPEPEPDGDKWYCASCYRGGQTWAPNWNEPGTTRCGACEKDRLEASERSAWLQLQDLSAVDQASARRQWASKWEQVLWAACGQEWRVTGAASGRIHL